MELKEKEAALEVAADKLGQVMKKQPENVKEVLRKLKEEAEDFCDKAKTEKEEYYDKAGLFVLAMTLDDNLKDIKELMDECQNYLEADQEHTAALMEKFMA